MAVEKASAHLDHTSAARDHDVRPAGQAFVVQHVSHACGVQRPTHHHLGFGVLGLYASHLRAAGRVSQERIASSMNG
jgi:hypothetical protein